MTGSEQIILKYFPNLDTQQQQRFAALRALYVEWNAQINVISRKDMDAFYTHHVLHSLAIAKVVRFFPGTQVLDIGTGGGFPGIPLAIMFPETKFHLVDSIGKKIKVVKEVAEALQLTNVVAEQKRAEELRTKYDFVISRAVAPWEEIYRWSSRLVAAKQINAIPNGWLLLKGGDLREELHSVRKRMLEYAISDFFQEEFFETKKVIYVPFG
jgi:16S rRNA (guanine527-N7)-methyltransferase